MKLKALIDFYDREEGCYIAAGQEIDRKSARAKALIDKGVAAEVKKSKKETGDEVDKACTE